MNFVSDMIKWVAAFVIWHGFMVISFVF